MPSWGSPARGAHVSSPNPLQSPQGHPSPGTDTRGQNRNRFQRHSPYPSNSPGQNRLFPTPEQIENTGGAPNFSSDNPFVSQTRFSADNPFQNTNDSLMGSENLYNPRDTSSPSHQRAPRPSFPSPLMHTPVGCGPQQRFSPRTPSSTNFNTPPSRFQSPMHRYQTPPNRFQQGYNRGFSSAKRGFGNRHGSFNNPGGSDDIQKYVQSSMLEDPWRNLPATPLLHTY